VAESGDADPATDPAEPPGAEPEADGRNPGEAHANGRNPGEAEADGRGPGEAEASEPGAGEEAAPEPAAPTPAAAKKPAAGKPAAKKPAAKKPATRSPAAKKPAAKRTAARRPPAAAPEEPAAPEPHTATPAAPLEPLRAVSFALGDDEYALPIAQVREVIAFRQPRDVASPTPWVRGVISLRGRIVPVCDLAARLGRGGEVAPSAKIVVVETPAGMAGLIVDSVREVLAVDAAHLDRVPLASDDAVTGIVRLGERLVVMLDASAVLAEADLRATARPRT
jgi:purine-binding chemotaxis protein CheW